MSDSAKDEPGDDLAELQRQPRAVAGLAGRATTSHSWPSCRRLERLPQPCQTISRRRRLVDGTGTRRHRRAGFHPGAAGLQLRGGTGRGGFRPAHFHWSTIPSPAPPPGSLGLLHPGGGGGPGIRSCAPQSGRLAGKRPSTQTGAGMCRRLSEAASA